MEKKIENISNLEDEYKKSIEDENEIPLKRRKLNNIELEEDLYDNYDNDDNNNNNYDYDDEIDTISNVSDKIYEYERNNEKYRIEHNLYGDDEEEDINEREWDYAESEDDLNYGYESDNNNY
jgi:hypothetical protein